MSTTPSPAPLSTNPAIPLTPAARAAYEDLYSKLQSELENTSDATALVTLDNSRDAVDTILDLDDSYRLSQNTALFNDLLDQIKQTNTSLATLKTQIAAVASHIATAASIIAAIDKVLTIIPTL